MVGGRRTGDRGMVKAARIIPDAVRATQARASDPAASAFVSANAGSGKTHVLVQRVIRLLLDDVAPEKILCITFTKAAAANMAERVFTTLGHWVTLDDDALDAAIRDAGIAASQRTLAQVGAQTVCLRAGDAGRAEGADHPRAVHAAAAAIPVRGQCAGAVCRARRPRPERDDGARQSRRFSSRRRAIPTAPPAARCMTAMASAADVTFKDVVREACLSRDHFMAWTDAAGSAQAAAAQISAALGVDPDDRIEDVERDIVDGPNLPRSRWQDDRAGSGNRQQDRSGPGGAAARCAGVHRRGAGRRISRRVPHRSRSHAAQIGGDEEILRQQSGHWPADSNRKPVASCP